MTNKINFSKWKDYRLKVLKEQDVDYMVSNHPVIEDLNVLSSYNFDSLVYNAQDLIAMSENKQLAPVERNEYKRKLKELNMSLRNTIEKITELEQVT